MSKKESLSRLMEGSGLGRALRLVGAWRGLVVLNYHRVVDEANPLFDRGTWSATTDALDKHLRFIVKNFEVVSPTDLTTSGPSGTARLVLLTFDDGYRDTYDLAYPVLRAHGVPATLFVTSGFLDRPRVSPWDEIAWMVHVSSTSVLPASEWLSEALPLHEMVQESTIRTLLGVYKSLHPAKTRSFLQYVADGTGSGRCDPTVGRDLWLTWDMVREMNAGGIEIGAHTVNHPVLSLLTKDEQDSEIFGSKERIERELGREVRLFSYPVGLRTSFNVDTRACLRSRGFELAFSYYGGYAASGRWDPFDVPRISVAINQSQTHFRETLTLPRLYGRY